MTDTPKFSEETLAELLAGYEKPEDLVGKGGILEQLTKALVEKALGAELSHHLGYAKGRGGSRSGRTSATATARSGC